LLTVSATADPLVSRVSVAKRSDGHGFVVRLHTDGAVKAFSTPRKISEFEYEVILFDVNVSATYVRPTDPGPLATFSLVRTNSRLSFRFTLSSRYEISTYRDGSSTDILVGLLRSADSGVAETPKGPSAEKRARWALDTIVIDAGHGGKDPGTSGNGFKEKNIALSVAKKLGKLINDELGVRVVYTRDDDRFIDLRERGRIANEAGAKLFVSIHVNSAPYSRLAQGTETYFLGMQQSDQAKSVTERENSVIKLEDNPGQYEEYDDQRLIRLALVQSGYMHQSERLASKIQSQFSEYVFRENRGVKQGNLQVLWAASMPAVLVELGFITNRKEAKYLASDEGQTELAMGLFRAISDYKTEYERNLKSGSGAW
jgi:N-acetylmuramoyl-L-alanine amidase